MRLSAKTYVKFLIHEQKFESHLKNMWIRGNVLNRDMKWNDVVRVQAHR